MTDNPAQDGDDGLLSDIWYFALLSRELRPGALSRKILFGEPLAFGRTKSGKAFALRDVCPHRAAPLSAGRYSGDDGSELECPYHGWRFRVSDGVCAAIPALAYGNGFDTEKIRVPRYPLHEANGVIWIYRAGDARKDAPPSVPPPQTGLAETFAPKIAVSLPGEGPFDEAVVGLVDPAHTPYVHRQWWWREGAGAHDKVKTFEPTALGFRMPAHVPSSNSRIYRMLGGAPTTEIEFRLPGVRLETIRIGKRTILGLTAITPTEPGRSEITHMIFWDLPLLTLLQPLAQHMTENFLGQDGAILREQNKNLKRLPLRPIYVGDPDEPTKWYFRMKRAWKDRSPGEAFVNPVEGGTLRWRT